MPKRSDKIKPHWVPKREKHQRLSDNSAFYNSVKWRRFSRVFKDRNPLCAECDRLGKVGPADVADHIVRIEDGGPEFDEKNIQSLCNKHHAEKSGREASINRDTP